ncbi:MAG TPA: glycosyltransferase [Thermoanaerobaculia bacterium]|nr:glycosyltransferase [Thermoanaerobaculia bacterium]
MPRHPERSEGSGRGKATDLVAVVPTLGASPHLAECLMALRGQEGVAIEVVLVDQSASGVGEVAGLADRVLRPGRNLGFAAGTNLGLQAADAAAEWLATVNDDAVVEPGWAASLIATLTQQANSAAAQGVNVRLDDPAVADGWGLTWNRRWQAVQLGHGKPPPPAADPPREVFGVSATAAVYRHAALAAVALPNGDVFDSRLGSWYEDADLACRLRATGWSALSVPAARARHAGSATGARGAASARRRWVAVYANRHLVLARLLGGGYWPRLPALLARDLLDLLRAALAADPSRLAGIPAGWLRAARRLPAFARRGRPAPPLAEVERLRVRSRE